MDGTDIQHDLKSGTRGTKRDETILRVYTAMFHAGKQVGKGSTHTKKIRKTQTHNTYDTMKRHTLVAQANVSLCYG